MPSEHATPSLIHRVRRSAAASAAGQMASQLISIGSLAILLRLVGPTNYGLVGMIAPIVLFLRIFTTFGLNVATVQRQEISNASVSSLFWMTILGGIVTASIAGALAPLVPRLYARPELQSELTQLTWALGGTLLLWAIGAQHIALLERTLRFGRLASIRVTSQFAGAVAAAAAAFGGWGVWALVLQQYVELTLLAVLAWASVDWRPRLPGVNSHAPSESESNFVRDTMRFGAYFAGASVVLFVADQLDRILLGRLAGPDAVGLYGQAKQLMIKPVFLVTTPLSAIVLSGMSRASTESPSESRLDSPSETRRALSLAFYRLLAILLAPAGVGLAFVAHDVMLLLGGAAWRSAGWYLAALAFGAFAHAVVIVNGWILAARGETTKMFTRATLVLMGQAFGVGAGWIVGAALGNGVLGVACGVTILAYVIGAAHTWLTLRTIGEPVAPVLRVWRRPLAATAFMAIALWGLSLTELFSNPFARIALKIPIGVSVFFLAALPDIRWLRSQAAQLRGNDA